MKTTSSGKHEEKCSWKMITGRRGRADQKVKIFDGVGKVYTLTGLVACLVGAILVSGSRETQLPEDDVLWENDKRRTWKIERCRQKQKRKKKEKKAPSASILFLHSGGMGENLHTHRSRLVETWTQRVELNATQNFRAWFVIPVRNRAAVEFGHMNIGNTNERSDHDTLFRKYEIEYSTLPCR